jgi:hypothetical protein
MSQELSRTEEPCPASEISEGSTTPTGSLEIPKEKYARPGGPHKEVTVTWRQLSVQVPASEAIHGDTLWSEIDPKELIQKFKKPKETVCMARHRLITGDMLTVFRQFFKTWMASFVLEKWFAPPPSRL